MMGLAQDVTHVQMKKNDEKMDKLYLGHLNFKLEMFFTFKQRR